MFEFNTESNEILIYDEIGPAWWGLIDAASVQDALGQMSGRVTVRLNTPGGSVDEGIAIFNALKRHPGGVDTVADSMAASMGSYLLQAGETRKVASNAMVMIHNVWSIAVGDADTFRKEADILDKYRDRMVPDYAAASGKTADEIEAIMEAETWYTGTEAVEAGFADSIESYEAETEIEPAVASLHRIARNMPADVAAMVAAKRLSKPRPKKSGKTNGSDQDKTKTRPRRDRARAIAAKLSR